MVVGGKKPTLSHDLHIGSSPSPSCAQEGDAPSRRAGNKILYCCALLIARVGLGPVKVKSNAMLTYTLRKIGSLMIHIE